jgi:hypothetical protein
MYVPSLEQLAMAKTIHAYIAWYSRAGYLMKNMVPDEMQLMPNTTTILQR